MDARSKVLPVSASSSSLSPEENASSIIRRGTLAAGIVGVSSSSPLSLSGDAFRDMKARSQRNLRVGGDAGLRERSAQTTCYVSTLKLLSGTIFSSLEYYSSRSSPLP